MSSLPEAQPNFREGAIANLRDASLALNNKLNETAFIKAVWSGENILKAVL